jgi:formylglycine-generating enzyme required for sulfatase activity
MLGGMLEYAHDWIEPYPTGLAVDPFGPETGEQRVMRGGSFLNWAGLCRAALRWNTLPDIQGRNAGVRPVRTLF